MNSTVISSGDIQAFLVFQNAILFAHQRFENSRDLSFALHPIGELIRCFQTTEANPSQDTNITAPLMLDLSPQS